MEPFDTVVSRHGTTVLRVCRAVVGPDLAEDVWAETFLAALRAYPQLPRGSNVEAWLVTIAHRKAIDALRARSRRPRPTAATADRADHRDLPGGWERDLREAVAALPERQRQAIAYHYLGGLPYAEVAALIGGSEQSVRKAASDGVARLRRLYREGSRT